MKHDIMDHFSAFRYCLLHFNCVSDYFKAVYFVQARAGGIPLSMKSKVLQDVTDEVDMPDMSSLYHFSLNKWDNIAWNHEIVHLYKSKTIMHHDNASYLAQLYNNISALSYGPSTKVALQTPWVQSEECNSSLP